MKKTYGAPGLMEWQALIPAGKTTVRINFSGGAMSGYGSFPARFSTDNEALQRLIENSTYFADKRIVLLSVEGHNKTPNRGGGQTTDTRVNTGMVLRPRLIKNEEYKKTNVK